MIRSEEWQFRLGPLDFGVGIRAIQLDEAFRGPADGPPAIPQGDERPGDRSARVGEAPGVWEAVLVWESEGGSLG